MLQDGGCVKKWWEIVQDGGCVKEQMAGPPAKMAAVRNVILKKVGNKVSPGSRWRLCKRTDGGPSGQDGCREQCNNIKKGGK
jgi:hypothetical protein